MSGTYMNPFAVLGISADSTEEEVRRAYRKLSLKYHPDKAGAGSTTRFQEIGNAYHMIIDEKLCGNNRWQAASGGQAQTRSRRTDTRDDTSRRSPPTRPRSRPPPRPAEQSPSGHRTRRDQDSNDRYRQDSRGYGFYDADRGVPLGSRQRRQESDFQNQEYRRHHDATREYPTGSRGFYGASREDSRSYRSRHESTSDERNNSPGFNRSSQSTARPQTRPTFATSSPGFSTRRPQAPPPQPRHPNPQRGSADTFNSIAQRLLHGLRVEQQRRIRTGVPVAQLENDIETAIGVIMRNLRGDPRVLGREVGRIMFLLRRLRFRYDPNRNAPRSATTGDFVTMAEALGISLLLGPVFFTHAASAFNSEGSSYVNTQDQDEEEDLLDFTDEEEDPYIFD